MSQRRANQSDSADDDLRQLFAQALNDIQPTVHKPAVRDVIARARGTRRHAPAGKPAPLAAILAVGATPLVALGAILIGPAGADIFSNGNAQPLPAATVTTVETLPPLSAPGRQPTPSTATPTTTPGASAVTPLTEVTVYFADQLLVDDGCRRLTATTRLVPADGLVEATLGALVAGPRAEERAAGLVSQFAAAETAPPITVTTDPESRVAVVDTDASFFAGTTTECRYDDIWRSLERTITQFDGWSFELRLAGSADAAAGLVAEDPTRPLDRSPDLLSDDSAPGSDPAIPGTAPGPGGDAAGPGAPGSESPAGAATTRVTQFTLVDADSDTDIGVLVDGATITLSELPTRNLSIRADTEPAAVGSVSWTLDGEVRSTVENGKPYAIRGDNQGDYAAWTPPVGTHVLAATPYSAPGGGGAPGAELSITFTVVE